MSTEENADITEASENISSKVRELQDMLAEASMEIAKKEENLDKKREDFEEKSKRLDHVHFGSMIKLDVGGKVFKTSLETLLKDPDSMLAAMFSGRFDLKPEKNGAYFIDRDGEHFRFLLNYLRNSKLICPNDHIILQELLEEAKFYQLQGVIKRLEYHPLMTELQILPMSAIIDTSNELQTLIGWLPFQFAKWKLLYRGSKDGLVASDFHRLCDGKGPTLVICKSSGGCVFGGFTTCSWETTPPGNNDIIFYPDEKAFLFSLVYPSSRETYKIPAMKGSIPGGILNIPICGPAFGRQDKNVSFHILRSNPPSGYPNYLSLGYGFATPAGKNGYFFTGTGSQTFAVTDLEVFEIIQH